MAKLVIFDFDGTIADSRVAYDHIIIKHLSPLGFSKKKIREAIDLGLNLWDTLGELIPSIPNRRLLKKKIMRDVLKEASTIKKCHNVGHIKEIQTKKILISNSLSEFVMPVLKHFKMIKAFDKIYCADDFDDKTEFMVNYLKKNKIKPKDCFYVGDRAADVILAREVKCNSIIVYGKCAWNSKKEIVAAKPDFIIPDFSLIKKIVECLR